MALAHLDPVAAFGRKTRGGCGSWCVCVWGCAGFEANGPGVCCVCVVDASKNMQGTGFEAKRIVPALPGTLSVYMYVYIFICVLVCVRVYVCVCVFPSRAMVSGGSFVGRRPLLVRDTIVRGGVRRCEGGASSTGGPSLVGGAPLLWGPSPTCGLGVASEALVKSRAWDQ